MIYSYLRVSTQEQGDHGHGRDAQLHAIVAAYPGELHIFEDVASGATLDRPELGRLLDEIKQGDTLVVAKLDRISRSVIDWCNLVERANEEGWAIVALDFNLDTGTPAGRFMATIMAGFAQMERELISERTIAGLAAAKAKGVKLGRPSSVPEEVRADIMQMVDDGMVQGAIAIDLNTQGIPAAEGGQWTQQAVSRVVLAEGAAS